MKLLPPEEPLYLIKNGSDPLERYFGDLRTMKQNNTKDHLEFMHISCLTAGLNYMIIEKHPNCACSKGKPLKRLCLDYSNSKNWDASKLKLGPVDVMSN